MLKTSIIGDYFYNPNSSLQNVTVLAFDTDKKQLFVIDNKQKIKITKTISSNQIEESEQMSQEECSLKDQIEELKEKNQTIQKELSVLKDILKNQYSKTFDLILKKLKQLESKNQKKSEENSEITENISDTNITEEKQIKDSTEQSQQQEQIKPTRKRRKLKE